MESNVPSEFQVVERENSTDSMYRSSPVSNDERLTAIRKELEYLNTMGKRFVAAFDRFQVHRALLAALRDLYSFSACCILLKGDPLELFIIPSYPLSASFLEVMIQRIVSAANVIDFPHIEAEQLASSAYLDAPDELALPQLQEGWGGGEIGSSLHIPLTVENRIMGMLSLFDERPDTFNTNLLQLTTMIADYAAVALENVRLRERENALWRQTEFERQRLELIIGSMAEGLLITDAQGAITSLNQSAQHLLAQANIDFQTEVPLHKLISTSDADWLPRLAEIVDQALNNKVVTNQELTIGESSETVPITLNISAAPLHDASGIAKRPIGVVAVLNDVTSIKQVERLKDDFVSVVSHELRTPLTAIKGYTQHLVRRVERRLRKARTVPENSTLVNELPESYDLHSLNIVQSQTEHLERLVNDLLDLSQVQWGKLNLHYETFYLADVLAESVRSAQASAELHTVYLDIQAQGTTIMADRMRVEQVIGNILDNAIKYSPHGGKVTVRLENRDKEYLMSIIDEGIGVSAEQFDHIFERFYRVHNTSIQQYSGIGLGLYVAKAIINGHGGQIWFTNNQSNGSTFHFTLPFRPPTVPLA
jgi:signal transduction histidine kinase